MITFDRVTFTYHGAARPALSGVDLRIGEGELCLVAGRTGVGKSTLLRAVNGLVPRFTGGRLSGRVAVAGTGTEERSPQEFAALVGVVGQDPLAGFVTDTVEEELAYGMEQLAIAPDTMRKRVEETIDLLGIADLRHRPLRTLSGGQQQRVAIGSVLTTHPAVLVLDEPTSALDPTAAEEVLAAVLRLVHDLGTTVLIAEHRMERVLQYADRLLHLPGDGTVRDGAPAEVIAGVDVAPPVVHLGRVAGWDPLPLSVRDARRHAPALRERLAARVPPPARSAAEDAEEAEPTLRARRITVVHGPTVAVREVALALRPGEVTALMGRNGSGKSSLLWALQGSGPRRSGTVDVAGDDPGKLPAHRARSLVGLVPQSAADLLHLRTVAAECAQADRESDAAPGTCRALLDAIAPGVGDGGHPRDLSEGQRLALVLAVQLTAAPRVMLLDEPTRGLDHHAKRAFARVVRELAERGGSVLIATHDVEFVAATADRVAVMAEGELVADGPTADVVCSSPAFAPQVAKVLRPQPWLTPEQVERALAVPESAR
ncbi:ABC transporter ATP-binding protein [Streptomyces radicis]|uniref:ATP-binding cassette domain-containing protein n=1 Tax=Streptomyces radicis TaxID=1750517 RepID=A0A3A9WH85_9ACTN|nr:ATP-binding cassette domain-containing protein [Streptomyces radicis]RKN12591.1 ATP-binding cassette domain-containing protein [Streptomyces radicis]RKN27645.1 ATP-binding cassette domain-containing protein [Streptomyces radicis]